MMEVLIGIVEDEVVAIQHVDGRARQARPSARATFVSQPGTLAPMIASH